MREQASTQAICHWSATWGSAARLSPLGPDARCQGQRWLASATMSATVPLSVGLGVGSWRQHRDDCRPLAGGRLLQEQPASGPDEAQPPQAWRPPEEQRPSGVCAGSGHSWRRL